MAQKDKVLDILALASLGEDAKVSQLAHRWVKRSMSYAQALAIVNCYFGNGRRQSIARDLFNEHHRQQRIRNERQAWATAEEERLKSPMLRFMGDRGKRAKDLRTLEIAKATFGQHVRDNFNADTLAIMSLIRGEVLSYQVLWMDAGFKPARSALIEVRTTSRPNKCQINKVNQRYLLYRINGRVLVARTKDRELSRAWGGQLPESLMVEVPKIIEQGHSFVSDLEGQEMVVVNGEGEEVRRVPWTGRTVDE